MYHYDQALNNLSVTEENKLRIIEAGALPHYVKLLSVDREEAEQLAAAQGLCKLASTHKDRITRQRGCLKGRHFITISRYVRAISIIRCVLKSSHL